MTLQALHLAPERDLHDPLYALLQAGLEPATALYHGANLFMAAFDTGGFATQSSSAAFYRSILVEIVLKQHRYEDFQRFETAIRNVEEVVECYATGGGIDYLLKVIAPDIDTYQRLIDRLLLAEIGIDRYFTYIVTRVVKASFQPPVALFNRFAAR